MEATWDEAKEGCESEGETLAVFPTLKSVIWLDQQLKGPDEGNEGSPVGFILSAGEAPKNNKLFDNGDYAVIFAFSSYGKSNLVGFNVTVF